MNTTSICISIQSLDGRVAGSSPILEKCFYGKKIRNGLLKNRRLSHRQGNVTFAGTSNLNQSNTAIWLAHAGPLVLHLFRVRRSFFSWGYIFFMISMFKRMYVSNLMLLAAISLLTSFSTIISPIIYIIQQLSTFPSLLSIWIFSS